MPSPDVVDTAAKAAAGVATDAAAGNVWAFGVFVVLVVAALIGLWILRSTARRPKADHDDDPDPACDMSPSGCPAIQSLVMQVAQLSKQLEADRSERQQHRLEVNQIVSGVHSRIDQLFMRAG